MNENSIQQFGFQRAHLTRKRARVDILPLIDVMFLLVAFFMILTVSMVVQRGIAVDLAGAQSGEQTTPKIEEIVVSVSAAGQFFFNKEEVTPEQLADMLVQEGKGENETVITLNADQESRHRSVIQALDIIRKSGHSNVVFAVEPLQE